MPVTELLRLLIAENQFVFRLISEKNKKLGLLYTIMTLGYVICDIKMYMKIKSDMHTVAIVSIKTIIKT